MMVVPTGESPSFFIQIHPPPLIWELEKLQPVSARQLEKVRPSPWSNWHHRMARCTQAGVLHSRETGQNQDGKSSSNAISHQWSAR